MEIKHSYIDWKIYKCTLIILTGGDGIGTSNQARGGHQDVREVSRWAGPLSNPCIWAALVGKKITLTIILASPKVDVLHSSDISAPASQYI